MQVFDDFTGDNDITNVREITLDNGNKLFLRRQDPYGFITFGLERGQLPEWMRGHYTSWKEAQKAVQQYLNIRRMDEAKKVDVISKQADLKKAIKD